MTQFSVPIPQQPIGECFVWRDWLQKLGAWVSTSGGSVSVSLTSGGGATISATLVEGIVVLNLPLYEEATTTSTLIITGLPSILRPTVTKRVITPVENRGIMSIGAVDITAAGILYFYPDQTMSSFLPHGIKGFAKNSITYSLT